MPKEKWELASLAWLETIFMDMVLKFPNIIENSEMQSYLISTKLPSILWQQLG